MPFSFQPDMTPPSASPGGQPPLAGSPPAPPRQTFGSAPPSAPTPSIANRVVETKGSFFGKLFAGAFILSLLIAGGLFAYQYTLASQVSSMKAQLNDYESSLSGIPLNDMRKMSNRIKAVTQLLKEHASVGVALKVIESSIENQVVYSSFDFHQSADASKTYQILIDGLSPDYKTIAQQMDTLRGKPFTTYLSDLSVEGLNPDEKGNIRFNLKTTIRIAGFIPDTFAVVTDTASTTPTPTPIATSTSQVVRSSATSTPVVVTSTSTTATSTSVSKTKGK